MRVAQGSTVFFMLVSLPAVTAPRLHARDALPSQGVPVDDRALRQKILDALAAQDWSYSAVFNVQVVDGHVELWGAVNSEEQRRAIHLAVEGVPGVRGITEHFGRVRPGYA